MIFQIYRIIQLVHRHKEVVFEMKIFNTSTNVFYAGLFVGAIVS